MSKELQVTEIIEAVSKVTNIRDITFVSKKWQYTFARFVVIGLALKHTPLTYPQIGALLKRDVATIYGAEYRASQLLDTHEGYQKIYNDVLAELEVLCA